MYLRYYLHGISNISTPGYRRVVRGLRRVRLLRPPRVRPRQLRLQVGGKIIKSIIFGGESKTL